MCDEKLDLAEGHFRCMMTKGHLGDHHNNTLTNQGPVSISWETSADHGDAR